MTQTLAVTMSPSSRLNPDSIMRFSATLDTSLLADRLVIDPSCTLDDLAQLLFGLEVFVPAVCVAARGRVFANRPSVRVEGEIEHEVLSEPALGATQSHLAFA